VLGEEKLKRLLVSLKTPKKWRAMDPIEIAESLKTLCDHFPRAEVAKRLGINEKGTLWSYLRLVDLPEEIKQHVREGRIGRDAAYRLTIRLNEQEQKAVADAILKYRLKSDELKGIVQALKKRNPNMSIEDTISLTLKARRQVTEEHVIVTKIEDETFAVLSRKSNETGIPVQELVKRTLTEVLSESGLSSLRLNGQLVFLTLNAEDYKNLVSAARERRIRLEDFIDALSRKGDFKLNLDKLKSKISIEGDSQGAILIGKYIACDGAKVGRPISIISHAHGDHTEQFESALSLCSSILMTKETKSLLVAEKGGYLNLRRNLVTLALGEEYTYNDCKITLLPASHILGSCQVLIVNGDGDRILYTGDFNYPSTPIVETDVLIMEASYGYSDCVRDRDQESLIAEFINIVKTTIEKHKSVSVIAHPGKIQFLMSRLRSADVDVPFLSNKKDLQWAQVYEQYQMRTGTVFEMRTPDALTVEKSGNPHVHFYRYGSTLPDDGHVRIRVSALGAHEAIYQPHEDYYVIALSDHADINGLTAYITRSGAKLVIIDRSRCELAETFARHVKEKFGIQAFALPFLE